MSDDIVTRLREVVAVPNGVDIWTLTALDAADEIERLRAEIERLCVASDVLAKAVATYCGDDAWADRALKAWQEARRD